MSSVSLKNRPTTLQDLNISPKTAGLVLQCVPSGDIKIFVESEQGRRPIFVDLSFTVKQVKEILAVLDQVPINRQTIQFRGRIVDNKDT